ncbi:MAG: ABC transporter permease [Bacteroidetes bacterium]|nr:ABC transporter permease [Bacteroidota bacterium]MBK8657973.1 ABC transporter permease [Bacteroidota bacterium]
MANTPAPSVSLNEKAWRRLRKNTGALFGLGVIVLALLLSLLAYVISPDNSPSANEQILQLETHPPGFSIHILKKKKDHFEKSGLVAGLFNGFAKDYEPIPLASYVMEADSLRFAEYRGKSFKTEEQILAYRDIAGLSAAATSADLKALVEHDLIVKRTFWLGTDKFGRDILSRLLIGVRVSISVGLISVIISLIIGIILGALAGYFRGWIDEVIMWVINVFWSIPTLLLAMGLYISAGTWIENKLAMIFIAVGLTMWVETARIVRGQFLSLREMEFVSAAKSLGYGHLRIIFIHILPNMLGPVIVVACANFANAILVESGLSYIGLGIQPPAPSWGSMLNEYKDFIDTSKAYLPLCPALAIMLMVLAFNLLGNGLRDALDVKGKTA